MTVGTVISKDNQLRVVTRVINDSVIVETKTLEEFISENIMLKYDGDFRTIKEIIQIESDKYLSKTTVVDEVNNLGEIIESKVVLSDIRGGFGKDLKEMLKPMSAIETLTMQKDK